MISVIITFIYLVSFDTLCELLLFEEQLFFFGLYLIGIIRDYYKNQTYYQEVYCFIITMIILIAYVQFVMFGSLVTDIQTWLLMLLTLQIIGVYLVRYHYFTLIKINLYLQYSFSSVTSLIFFTFRLLAMLLLIVNTDLLIIPFLFNPAIVESAEHSDNFAEELERLYKKCRGESCEEDEEIRFFNKDTWQNRTFEAGASFNIEGINESLTLISGKLDINKEGLNAELSVAGVKLSHTEIPSRGNTPEPEVPAVDYTDGSVIKKQVEIGGENQTFKIETTKTVKGSHVKEELDINLKSTIEVVDKNGFGFSTKGFCKFHSDSQSDSSDNEKY